MEISCETVGNFRMLTQVMGHIPRPWVTLGILWWLAVMLAEFHFVPNMHIENDLVSIRRTSNHTAIVSTIVPK